MIQTESKKYYQHLMNTMGVSFCVSNLSAIVGSPIDRLKTGVQVELNQSGSSVFKNVFRGGQGSLWAGLKIGVLRQNMKFCYRTLLTTDLAGRIDRVFEGCPHEKNVSLVVKSIFACVFDTTMTTPFETIKTQQMKTPGVGVRDAFKRIVQTQGAIGLLNGWTPSFVKSCPAWFNLFFTHQVATQTLKKYNQENSFLKIVAAATISAVPVTLVTTPFDVIKSNMQHHLHQKGCVKPSMFNVAKKIAMEQGISKLWRGTVLRIIHRTQNLIVGLIVLNYFHQKRD